MDLNGDGYSDILSGSYSRHEQPMAGLFQVLWGKPGGAFQKAAVLNSSNGKPLEIPSGSKDEVAESICTRPFAVDWNGDGKLDLVVGTFSGSFYLFTGEGRGQFQPTPQALKAGDRPLKLPSHHGDPFVVDWDGDGDLDLLSGSADGAVYWAENTAGKGKPPSLKPFEILIKPGPARKYGELLNENEITGPGSSTRIWVDDLNGDGKLDILVGDSVALFSPAEGISKGEYAKRFTKWDKSWQAVQKEVNSNSESMKARERFDKVWNERRAFMNEERTGYVWMFLRK